MANYQVRIDKNLLDQAKFFQGNNGKCYINLVLWENRNGADQYGNTHIVKQDSSKEERDAGVQVPIVGNAKPMGQAGGGQQRPANNNGGGYRNNNGGGNQGGNGNWNNNNQNNNQGGSRKLQDDSGW